MRGYFNPRPPRGGRRRTDLRGVPCIRISIHAPREGGDASQLGARGDPLYFNPRPPRGGRLFLHFITSPHHQISIHAPREGGDPRCGTTTASPPTHFNPRPPRGGRRHQFRIGAHQIQFQSTPPARGATILTCQNVLFIINFNPRPPRGGRRRMCSRPPSMSPNFNPRPPRGGRRASLWSCAPCCAISIHAPREGGDA